MKKERIEGKEIEIECEPEPEPEAVSVPMVQVSFQARGKDSGSGIECRLGRLPIVVLSAEALGQMLGYLTATRLEVSALGAVERDGAVFRVTRFHLVEQKSSTAGVELSEAGVGALISELIDTGRSEEAGSLRCWLHSHPGMNAFWSGTDDKTCRILGGEYLVSIVVGLKPGLPPAIRCRIDLSGAIPITLDHVPVLAEVAADAALLKRYEEEVAAKVKAQPILTRLVRPGKEENMKTELEVSGDELDWWYETGLASEADMDDPFFY